MLGIRKILAISLAASMIIPAAACSSKTDQTSSSAASDVTVGSRDATLRFSWWGGDDRAQATLKVIKQFESLYPKIKIEAEYGSVDGYNDKLATQISAGTAPDIIQMLTTAMPQYVSNKADNFVDFKKQPITLGGFDPKMLNILGNFDGKQLGLPTGISGTNLIVNTDLASKVGIDLVKTQYTWDDLLEMGKKVEAYDKNTYVLSSNLKYNRTAILRPYIEQLTGHGIIDDKTKKVAVTEEQLTQALTLIKQLYDDHVIPPETHMAAYEEDNIPKDPNWISGKYVAAFTTTAQMTVAASANKSATYAAGKMPGLKNQKNGGYYVSATNYICVNANSKYVPEAVKFADYFFNNADAAKTLGVVRSAPAVNSALKVCVDNHLIDSLTKDAVDIAESYTGLSDEGIGTTSEAEAIESDIISTIAYGKSDPAAAASKMISQLNSYLANQK